MQELITLKLRPTTDYTLSPSFSLRRSARRCENRDIYYPIQLTLCPNSSPKNSTLNLKRLSIKPRIPTENLKKAASMPKIYHLFPTQAPPASYSRKDWELAVEDIKTLYTDRQYKLCAERCISILKNPRGFIHYVHSIFFSFYAATCFEMQALSLHIKSPAKLLLLDHAKSYYEIAASHVSRTETTDNGPFLPALSESRSRSLSSSSSISSISHSPVDSLALHSPPSSSPASSTYDFDNQEKEIHNLHNEKQPLEPRPLNLRAKKKVSFRSNVSGVFSNGHIKVTSSIDSGEHFLPLPPTSSSSIQKSRSFSPYNLPLPPGPPPMISLPALLTKSQQKLPHPNSVSKLVRLETATKQAIIRDQSRLLTFKPRISYHLIELSKLISATSSKTAVYFRNHHHHQDPSSESLILKPSSEHPYSQQQSYTPRFPYIKNESEEHRSHTQSSQNTYCSNPNEAGFEDMKNIAMCNTNMNGDRRRRNNMSLEQRRARIEEGRSRMWVKEKFDGKRYKRLCERALMELTH